jgi:hypothetical protein
MKAKAIYAAAVLAIAIPFVAPTTAAAQKVEAWDKITRKAKRFVVLRQFDFDAVLDSETGLVWQRSPDVTLRNWYQANEFCNRDAIIGERMGWRLPTVQELTSLLGGPLNANGRPVLPAGHPFGITDQSNGDAAEFWSATVDAESDDAHAGRLAWTVSVSEVDSNVHHDTPKTFNHPDNPRWTLCVRFRQGVDVQ